MPDHWQYAALLAGCLLITLPLELVLGARVYRQPRRLVRAMLPVIVIFVAWDLVGIARDHWSYNPRFVTGVDLGPMPVEELAFFLVIPLCGLLTYEGVGRVLSLVGRLRRAREEQDA
jgi:lycopene cyclase domain-containing protein